MAGLQAKADNGKVVMAASIARSGAAQLKRVAQLS